MEKIKSNEKGFSLIELLVVVAIIGILAAVGIVAYSGYTASAKVNASKNNHSTIVKFISAEKTKCDTGASTLMGVVTTAGAANTAATCVANTGSTAAVATTAAATFMAHFEGKNFKNPHTSSIMATGGTACPITTLGCTVITSGTGTLTVTTYADSATGGTLTDLISLN